MELNKLQKWELEHREKILTEIKKANIDFTLENLDEIINETSFKVRSKKYPYECSLYLPPKQCHLKIKDLNCFLCDCPNYNSDTLQGGCNINSKLGKWYHYGDSKKEKVWDCTDCPAYHSKKSVKNFIKKNFKQLQEEFNKCNQ